MRTKKAAALTLVALSLMVALTQAGALAPREPISPKPQPTVGSSLGPNPGPYGYLYQLWSGGAYFERQTYTSLDETGNPTNFDEANPIARPDLGPNAVWLYYRHPVAGTVEGDGIGLAESNDGGVTFQAIAGNPVVRKGGCFYETRAVSPSVVYAPKPGGSGSQFYMVFEGAGIVTGSSGNNPCNIPLTCIPFTNICAGTIVNFGNVFLTTSTDGLNWSAPQIIIGVDTACNNVGTPFIGYFNSKFYVFYHELCPAGVTQTVAQTGIGTSVIMMASGTDPTNLSHHGQVMALGNSYAWDSRVNTHASVVAEPDNTRQTYYYMVFEGSRNPYGVTGSNWGWGIARTTNIDGASWQKYQYNPIRQTFNGGLGNDIPHILQFNGAIRVFQRGQGASNVLMQGTTYSQTVGNPGIIVTHPGGDPYLYVFPSRSQCAASSNNDGIGRLDPDGISWSVNTHDDTTHNVYMCKGPNVNGLGGQFAVDFNLSIDVNTCPGWPISCKVLGLDFVDPSYSPSNFNGVTDETTINRDAFASANTFQAFHNQFFGYTTHDYSWRTFWSGTSYLKQANVALRNLDQSDTTPPSTSMGSLPANSQPDFQVSWSGTDDQSGIWDYDVQYQVDGGQWQPWLTATGSVSAYFTKEQFQCYHTYAFEARARDNAGNLGSYSSLVSTYIPCNFSLSTNPASLAITVGSQQQSTITVTSNGYSGSVTLTQSPSSNAVNCVFAGGASSTTVSVASTGSATATTTCTGTGPPGPYGVLYTGTGGSLSSSVNLAISVTDFSLSLPSIYLLSGSSTSSNVALASLQGFSGTIGIGYSAPSGLTMSCPSTASITSGGGSVSCTFSSSTPGDYSVSITGSFTPTNEYYNAPISHTITTIVHVSSFTISANPSSLTMTIGSEQQTTLTVTSVNGFSGNVNITRSTPGMVTCWFNGPATSIIVNVPAGGYATTVPACTSAAPAGVYNVNFTATSGSLSKSAMVPVTVQDFAISSPNVQFQIGSTTSAVTITSLQGFAGTVSLTASAQSGVTVSCPASATVPSGGSVTITCTYASSTPGAYALVINGTFTPTSEYYNAPIKHTLNLAVGVVDFVVALGPATQTVSTTSTASFALTITQIGGFSNTVDMGFNYTVSLVASAPPGVSCSISASSISMPPTPILATVLCSSSSAGNYPISVTGTSGSLVHTGSAQLLVNQDFQFLDNFNYGQANQMPPIGYYAYGNQSMAGGVLTLSNNGMTGSFAGWTKVSPGVNQWTVSENVKWVSGRNSLYGTLELVANTTSHTYTWTADGFYNQYILYRDGQIILRVNAYAPQLNVWHTLRIDMVKGTLYLYFDGNLITTYTDSSTNNSLTQFGPAAGWESTDNFNFLKAAALVATTSTSTPTLVANPSVRTQPFAYPWAGNGFYAQGRDWIFYVNSGSCSGTTTNCLYYATSTNGATWSNYNIGVVSGATPSVVTNGTQVFYVRYNGTDSQSGKAIMFGLGTLHMDGTISWLPESVVEPASSGTYYYHLFVRVSSTGQAFVGYQTATTSGGNGLPYAVHSNGLSYSSWQGNMLLVNRTDTWRFTGVPLANGQMYVLYWPAWGLLRGRLWSNGSWGSQEIVTPSNTYVQQTAFGFSDGNSTVYAIWQERTSQKIQFATRAGSWGSPQTIATADVATYPAWTASYDSLQGKWYIVYYNYTLNQIYQYSGVPGSWSGKTILFNTSATSSSVYIGSFQTTGQVTPYRSVLGIFWTQDPTTRLELRFANETIILQPRTMLIHSPATQHLEWLPQPQNWLVAIASLMALAGTLLSFAGHTETRLYHFRRRNQTGVRLALGPLSSGNSFCINFPPSPTFLLGHDLPRIMQNIERCLLPTMPETPPHTRSDTDQTPTLSAVS